MSDVIKETITKLVAQRTVIDAASAPLRAQRTALQEQSAPIDAQIRELTLKIREIEGAELVTLDRQIGTLHRSLGAQSMSASSNQG